MELANQIGQLFMLGFKGAELTPDNSIMEDLCKKNLGGVILFDALLAQKQTKNNIKKPGQVKALTQSLQQHAATPLLIAIDQEGGLVRRLKTEAGFPKTESPQTMGQADDSTRTAIQAACTAVTLRHLGINLNLAPSVDLNTFPDNPVIGKLKRSFSENSETLIRHAAIWVREHRKQNILSCLKHFPGHGSSKTDSHLGFTDISTTWQEEELTPFKILIEQQLADCVMSGHLFHSDLDSEYPTSLSANVINKLLRGTLGFNGLVITDDLQMKAITDKYGLEEAVCLAFAAGADMIIIGNNLKYEPHIMDRIIPAVLTKIKEGVIEEKRIHEALQRVETIKKRLE